MEDKGQYNEKDKKIRGRTFSRQEIDTLLEFVKKYYSVIENKGTDAVTWKTKQQCWEKISAEFDSAGIYGRRSATQLHNKWNLLKKTARREYVGEKKYAMGTGGGEYKAPGISDVSKKVHELGAQTIEGGTNDVDCDTVEDEPRIPHSNQLSEPSSPQPVEVQNVQDLLGLENIVIEYNEESDEEQNIISEVPENNWATYTPASFKKPIHPALNISKTPVKRKFTTNTKNVVKTHSEFVNAKKEVADLQKKYFSILTEIQVQEGKNKKEQHEWARAEHKIKMEILREELRQLKEKEHN